MKQVTIKNARTHNLKNIDLNIPHQQLIVITGVSGSGKTSLAYDTLYAEGHRRYIESLSSYARQFIERLPKPPVDYIKGLSPCIALEQKVVSNNPRSTVGTVTEIYDYIRILFARLGKIIHPVSGKEIKRHYPQDVVAFIQSLPIHSNILIVNKLNPTQSVKQQLETLLESGFSRILINHQIVKIKDAIQNLPQYIQSIYLIIDRVYLSDEKLDEDWVSRITDSIETAYNQGNGMCYVIVQNNEQWDEYKFNNTLESDGLGFEEPSPQLFAFNNPYGICPYCKGTGRVFDFDIDKLIRDKTKSFTQGAFFGLPKNVEHNFIKQYSKDSDVLQKPLLHFSENELYNFLYNKTKPHYGLITLLQQYEKSLSNYYWTPLNHLKSYIKCPECKGSRLRKEALYIQIQGKTIADYVQIPVGELLQYFRLEVVPNLPYQQSIQPLLNEITHRLQYLCDVGLEYLTLNREMKTLSGGESQRVFLTTSLGSSLTGSIYILDEPTTGLHPRDTDKLIKILKKLRDEGNTVVVVEHDEEVMKNADMIIDIGPKAGKNGGKVVFQGNFQGIQNASGSLTAEYLSGKKNVQNYSFQKQPPEYIYLKNATANNLKNISIQFPFNAITCITGPSGSGKSTLIENEMIPEAEKILLHHQHSEKISGAIKKLHSIHYINQHSISTSSRSNCATYTKVYDDIRFLFSRYSKMQGIPLDPAYFSFNVPGGRCETCQGEGIVRIPMQFMADIEMVCEECKGKRFSSEVLQVKILDKNISDILEMSIDDAYDFFEKENQFLELKNKITKTLNILKSVGLGYIPMGQATSKMSGGELQRLKIATFIQEEKPQPSLFILDEPSTGLHFYDIDVLMKSLSQLIIKGHTILIIEHHLDIIKNADWIIDLGPEGGNKGGELIFQGPIHQFMNHENSITAFYLRKKLNCVNQC